MREGQRADGERFEEAELLAPGLIHEMRHPLMGLKAGMLLLERRLGGAVDVGRLEEWELLKAQLQRLEELFQHYQDFLHPEQVPPAPFAVQPVVKRAVELLGYRLKRLGRRFSLEAPATPVEARGTPGSLAHALTNVLVNALDALDEAGGDKRLAVRVLAPAADGTVQVRVSDEGPGIPEDVAAHIFEARFTTKPPGKGTGLGLSLARRMLGSCGATIRLAPAQEPGRLAWARTEFVLELPPAAQPAAAPAPAAQATPPSVRAGAEAPLRALVVDDEAIILLLLRLTLSQAHIDVTTATSGTEAAELLRAQRFDLLITDKNLPGPSGVELATQARAANPHMAIVLMTGYASRDSAEAVFQVGIDEYLTKPFEAEELTARLRPLLARRRARALLPAADAARPRRVLVVEEDPQESSRLMLALQRQGHTVVHTRDVLEALRAGTPLDALIAPAALLDAAVREELRRQQERRAGPKVIVLVDPASLGDTIAAIAVGARVRLSRPLEDASLERTLADALKEGTP